METFDEILEMLTGKKRGRANEGHLHTGHSGNEGRPQRNFGLAEANIAHDKPVHWLASCQIFDHLRDRALLIIGFLIGEAVDEFGIMLRIRLGHVACTQGAQRRGGDQFTRNLADAFTHLRLATLPGLAAQTVQRHTIAVAAIAGQDVDVLDRHIKLVATRIRQRHAIMRRLRHGDLRQPFIAADAVLCMDDKVTG